MKRVTSLTVAASLLATPVLAGSASLPPQPVVLPPMQVTAPAAYNWSGAYAGISTGTTRTKHHRPTYETRQENRPMNKADLHNHINAMGGCGAEVASDSYVLERGPVSWIAGCESIANNTPDKGRMEWQVPGQEVIEREWQEQTGTETYRRSHATWGLFAGYRHQFGIGVVLGAEAAWHRAETDQIEVKAQAGFALGCALPFAVAGWEFESGEALYGVGIDYGLTSRITVGSEFARFGDSERLTARIGWRF